MFCRVLADGEGAEWPLSRKFGCEPKMAIDVLRHAYRLGLDAHGVSFHVGSQRASRRMGQALSDARGVFQALEKEGIVLKLVTWAAVPDVT